MIAAPIFPPKTEKIATAKTFHSTPVADPGEDPLSQGLDDRPLLIARSGSGTVHKFAEALF